MVRGQQYKVLKLVYRTFVDSDADFENEVTGQPLSIEGLSEDNFNITLFYENDTVSVRLSYNFRSEFLQTSSGLNGLPIFVEDFGQFDAAFRYTFSDSLSFSLDAINLDDEPLQKFNEVPSQVRSFSQNGRKVVAGLKFTF